MINLEIQKSTDNNVLNTYQFFQNQIYLGKSTGDLCIDDNGILPSHVMLEVLGKELLIHPQKGVDFFLINGKRASNIRKLKMNDLITLGNTIIKICAFEETEIPVKRIILDKKLNQLVAEDSNRLPIIERLTQLMK